MHIKEIAHNIHDNAKRHGWWPKGQDRNIPEMIALVHSEASEALEGYRKNIKPGQKGWLGEELADIVIRVFDMAEGLGIDIEYEIKSKHAKNINRPYRHGGKRC